MKIKSLLFVIITIVFSCTSSCKKSNNTTTGYTPDCSGSEPKFSTEVQALLLSSCATSGCHNSGSNEGPGALTTYAQIKSASSVIRSSVVRGSMPQNSSLTTAQKNTIVCWIDAGANNN